MYTRVASPSPTPSPSPSSSPFFCFVTTTPILRRFECCFAIPNLAPVGGGKGKRVGDRTIEAKRGCWRTRWPSSSRSTWATMSSASIRTHSRSAPGVVCLFFFLCVDVVTCLCCGCYRNCRPALGGDCMRGCFFFGEVGRDYSGWLHSSNSDWPCMLVFLLICGA